MIAPQGKQNDAKKDDHQVYKLAKIRAESHRDCTSRVKPHITIYSTIEKWQNVRQTSTEQSLNAFIQSRGVTMYMFYMWLKYSA